MKKSIFSFLTCTFIAMAAAQANWQYPNNYTRDSWNGDDGMRFTLSVRGGAAFGNAKIKNEIGGLTGQYMQNVDTGEIVTLAWQTAVDPDGNYVNAGYGRLGDLPAGKNYKETTTVIGFSAGFTMPETPQWRLEFGFDHIAESDYNQSPLFEGTLDLTSGLSVEAQSGAVQSSLASDIYSVMAFYDFFTGISKPMHTMIPYIGVGAGYADTKTVLQLTDSYGDLSDVYELQNFGVVDDAGVIQFNKAETHTSNLVPVAAVGISYGISDKMFLDLGVRAMYIPKIKWQLTNGDTDNSTEKRRDWFSAENMLYLNAMIGLRVEF